MGITFSDTFDGSNGGPWDPGKWAIAAQGSGIVDIQEGEGRIRAGGSNYAGARGVAIMSPVADGEVRGTFRFASTSGDRHAIINLRQSGTFSHGADPHNAYQLELRPHVSQVRLQKRVNNSRTIFGAAVPFVFGNQIYHFAFRITGFDLKAKIWPTGSSEPDSWTIERTDGPASLSSGVLVLAAINGNSSTEQTVFWDNIHFDDLQGGDPPPPPVAQVRWTVPGMTTSSSVTVSVKTTIGLSDVRLQYGTGSDFANAVETSPQPSDGGGFYTTKFVLTGLVPGTQYFYRPVLNGTPTEIIGKIKTAPENGTPWSGRFAYGSCAYTGSTADTFSRMLARNPEMMIHLGDLHYADIASNDEALFHAAYDSSLGVEQQNALYRSCSFFYIPEDHDGGPDNRTRTAASLPAMVAAYQRAIPHLPLPGIAAGTRALYQSVVRGRVRIIFLDVRNERESPGMNATILGAQQKQWLKDELLAAKSAGQAIILISGCPWSGPDLQGDDGWRGYINERNEIADFIYNNELVNRVVLLFGDMHGMAYDDGSNSNYRTGKPGGEKAFPMFGAAPFEHISSLKGGPYTGHFPTNVGGLVRQYGIIDVEDTGSDIVSVTYSGYKSDDSLWISQTISLTTGSTQQVVRPASTISSGDWVAVGAETLHQALNELTPSDTEYVQSPTGPTDTSFRVRLDPLLIPANKSGWKLHIRHMKDNDDQTISQRIRLFSGASLIREEIVSSGIGAQTAEIVLTEAEAAQIVDGTTIEVEIIANSH